MYFSYRSFYLRLRNITTIGDAGAVSDLLTLLVDFDTGFPVVEP